MFDELPNRESWFEVTTVTLGDTKGLPLIVRSRTWRTIACLDMLAVSTVVPSWALGWHAIIPDEPARDILTWYLHYARQYIHRSHVAKVLMIAWERDGRVLHPFGRWGAREYYGPVAPAPSLTRMLDIATEYAHKQWGVAENPTQIRSIWSQVNTLDPHIHQSIFHFTRGQSLLAGAFEMEAVVAFDCVMQSLKSSAANWRLRSQAAATFASCWGWVAEPLPSPTKPTAERALRKAAALESTMRTIEPAPKNWSDWLSQNFGTIWDVVWFDKVHGL
jgi:hypothetical protein